MDPSKVRQLLERVRAGDASVEDALRDLADLPFKDLGFARVDHHRHLRTGFPEVVLGLGKSAEQIGQIMIELARTGANVLATRVPDQHVAPVLAMLPAARHEKLAHALVVEQQAIADTGRGTVLVVSAGTSDLPVAEEAALTARLAGNRVERLVDVGVAGIHRLLGSRSALETASVIVVVAGMEGALPSVVAGLTSRPVVAVPTSIGYGASFGGIAALLGMLNSCAAGVTVVNIDNGFGAGYAAALINRKTET
ncbi:MAG: 1-(5-phosphoribosyl)-5-amino-4-imidazole-carboxylate carboxylase [bacterium]|nr:1-(5-phosphoribosyl)-5-amino-4-imidazole-carboxylate carboxylase [bacterium]